MGHILSRSGPYPYFVIWCRHVGEGFVDAWFFSILYLTCDTSSRPYLYFVIWCRYVGEDFVNPCFFQYNIPHMRHIQTIFLIRDLVKTYRRRFCESLDFQYTISHMRHIQTIYLFRDLVWRCRRRFLDPWCFFSILCLTWDMSRSYPYFMIWCRYVGEDF